MSGSRWVITSLWLSGSWKSFLYSSSVYSYHLFLISSAASAWFSHSVFQNPRQHQHESESCSVVSDSLRPHGLCSAWNSPVQNTGWVAFPFSRDLPNPGIKPGSPASQADSLPTELSGMPCIKKQIVKCIHYCQSSLTLHKIARKTFLDKQLVVNFFTFFLNLAKCIWSTNTEYEEDIALKSLSLSLCFF